MNKKCKTIIMAMVLTAVIVAASVLISSAGTSLLSPGTSRITSDSSFDFTLNAGALDTSDSKVEEQLTEYVIALSVTPSVSDLSVKEGVGSLNAVSGEYQVTSSQLGDTSVLHFTVTPAQDLTEETTYTVSVNVTGGVTASDSFSFIVTPVSTQSSSEESGTEESANGGQTGERDQGFGSMPNMKGSQKMSAGSLSGGGSYSGSTNVTYAGSWDNYLDELSVDGYEFTQTFNKTRTTYVMSVPEDVDSLDVTATASDSSAVVAVTGSSELKTGRNKIMISVTADDGSVRVYRIYVDKQTETAAASGSDSEENDDRD